MSLSKGHDSQLSEHIEVINSAAERSIPNADIRSASGLNSQPFVIRNSVSEDYTMDDNAPLLREYADTLGNITHNQEKTKLSHSSLRPETTKPFRFSDLPGEIRNKIYAILLCSFEHQETDATATGLHKLDLNITMLRHNISPQILRTSRTVYNEARYVMQRTNLFVVVTFASNFGDLAGLMMGKHLPILPVSWNFKGFVMAHDVVTPDSTGKDLVRFAFLYRDLPCFCSALSDMKWLAKGHDENISHSVTLVNPCEDTTEPNSLINSGTFYTRALQEKLIAPYRTILRGYTKFDIGGIIPKDLRVSAISEITRPQPVDPEKFLRELEETKRQGNEYFRKGDGDRADDSWQAALTKLQWVMEGSTGQQLRDAGGAKFINGLAALTFDIKSNCGQRFLKEMRANQTNPRLVHELGAKCIEVTKRAIVARFFYPDVNCDWNPTMKQCAKLFYRQAVALRLMGSREYLVTAEEQIDRAISVMPPDDELQREKERISQWRRRLEG
jgi:hypothetical protein